jgi:hypothetical protein
MLGITVRSTPGTMEMIENKWPITGKYQKGIREGSKGI